MKRLSCLIALSSLMLASGSMASSADAQLVQKTYQLAMDKWALDMRVATTPADREKAWEARPDAATFAKKMWDQIGNSLTEEWSIEPAAWFLLTTQGLIVTNTNGSTTPVFAKENEAIRTAVVSYHMNSVKLVPMCVALVADKDPRGLVILEKIQASHTDKKIQGVAALGAAMRLKDIGDDREILKRRIDYLRKAIIQSADVDISGTTVAKLAEEELYIIRFLSKGSTAPELTGVDAAGRPLALSTYKGKIVVLLFWNSNVAEVARVVEITKALEQKYRGKPVVILGVNNDPLEKLRTLQGDGTVSWTNFSDPGNKLSTIYRIGTWPLVYVLDKENKIRHAGAPGSFVELTADALLAEGKPAPAK